MIFTLSVLVSLRAKETETNHEEILKAGPEFLGLGAGSFPGESCYASMLTV